jgi:chemotaxis protein MotB
MRFFLAMLSFSILSGCVKAKSFRREQIARNAAEAREKVLGQELGDRKTESAKLIAEVGELNRIIGGLQQEMSTLRQELDSRTQQMGASSSKLADEVKQLQRDLNSANTRLSQAQDRLGKIQDIQARRQKILDDIDSTLVSDYAGFAEQGITLVKERETLLLSLPDKALFETNGISVSSAGKDLLQPLASLLAARPSLDVDVVAYTDNVLPAKEKNLKDTWDWSLQRATNLVRLLIREYNTNANQLTPVGRGEYYPLSSNETPEGRQKNRRTVVVIRPTLPN